MALDGTRVLLVEDDGLIAILLESMLELLNCEVVGSAVRVPEALEKIGTIAFDLALLDVNLAGTMSFPVADALKALGKPFIFTTSYGRLALPPAMRAMPVLSKPFNLPALTAALVALRQGEPAHPV